MSLSKQSEKYWQRGDNFGACVSQLFSRGKNDRLGENVSQLYSERKTFQMRLPFLYFFVPVSSRKKIQENMKKSRDLCCSVHMRSFLSRLKGEVDDEIAHPET